MRWCAAPLLLPRAQPLAGTAMSGANGQSIDPAMELSGRLYSYGRAAPKSLVTMRRPGTVKAPLDPIRTPLVSQGPPLRQRTPADAALAYPSQDVLALSASKQGLTDPLGGAAPLPYNKMTRSHARLAEEAEERAANAAAPDRAAGGFEPPAAAPTASEADDKRRDPFWFIRMLRTELSDHEFAYMNVADTGGTTWDPYNLKIVAFSEVNPSNHYTISEAGVTHCIRRGKEEVAEFTPLDQWEKECGLFKEVMDIPFFKRYQSWKAYYSWRRVVKSDKFSTCRDVLTKNLFILNDTFQVSVFAPPRALHAFLTSLCTVRSLRFSV